MGTACLHRCDNLRRKLRSHASGLGAGRELSLVAPPRRSSRSLCSSAANHCATEGRAINQAAYRTGPSPAKRNPRPVDPEHPLFFPPPNNPTLLAPQDNKPRSPGGRAGGRGAARAARRVRAYGRKGPVAAARVWGRCGNEVVRIAPRGSYVAPPRPAPPPAPPAPAPRYVAPL